MSTLITLQPTPDGPLAGRVLMLNTEKAPRFFCYGFSVTRNNPIQTVPAVSGEDRLRQALNEGILMDVTGREDVPGVNKTLQAIDKAMKSGNITDLGEEQVGPKVLIGKDQQGNSYVIIPKDEADLAQMHEELRLNGFIRRARPKADNFSGLSTIYEEELPPIDRQV